MALPGDPDGYPGKDEIADYLEAYAARYRLDVHGGEPVTSVSAEGDGGFRVETARACYRPRQLVVATGPFSTALPPEVSHPHSSAYRRPSQLAAGPVVVVGAGNTGVQIADELSATRRVGLAVGTANPSVPQRLLGRDVFWWLERLGMIRAGRQTRRVDGSVAAPGLQFVGLPWQRSRGSALLGWVGEDAALVADRIAAQRAGVMAAAA